MAPKNEAFIELYDKYVDSIYRFVYMRVSDKDTAWDITQECFLKSLEYFNNNKVKNHRAFLYQVARNLVIDFWRWKGKHSTLDIDDLKHSIKDDFNIEESLNIKQEMESMMEMVKTLPEEHQMLVTLRYVDELSFAEIAQITGKNQVALRVQASRIIKNLKIKFKDNKEIKK